MWGVNLEELDSSIFNRVPIRDDLNDLYFPNESFQALPKYGYTDLFNNILRHENIDIKLNTKFNQNLEKKLFSHF